MTTAALAVDALTDGPGAAGTAAARATGRTLDPMLLAPLSERSDLRGAGRFAVHLGCIAVTGVLVRLALPNWYLLVPAMFLHGLMIVTMFAPMHECVHRTAFASRAANEAVGWIAGVLSFYNSTFYRHYHAWHHRYTQDPERDPELIYPKARTLWEYTKEISGVMFWVRRAIDYPSIALGRFDNLPFVPVSARRSVSISMSVQLAIYLAGAVSIVLGYPAVLYYWFLPAFLAQPVLRALLIVEHTGCSQDSNGLSNTRTTIAGFPIRLIMWNMSFHAEHHLYPVVPFHQLAGLHRKVRDSLVHLEPSYVASNRAVIRSL